MNNNEEFEQTTETFIAIIDKFVVNVTASMEHVYWSSAK